MTVVDSSSLILDIRTVLAAWRAPSYEQELLCEDFLALAHSSSQAAFRHNSPDHITASTLVFSSDLRRVALLFHPKFDRWLQMGGHCETSDASLSRAAIREAKEETSLTDLELDPEPVLLSRHRVRCWPDGHHYDVQFMAVAQPDARLICSAESADLRWFGIDEVARVSDQSVIDLLAASLARLS